MSIASAIAAAQGRVADCYTAISNKGGTLPQTRNLSNMPTAIASIPSGTTPTGTLSITSNGVYDVTNYASANVSVSSSNKINYIFYNCVMWPANIYLLTGSVSSYNSALVVTPKLSSGLTERGTVDYWQIDANTNYSVFAYNSSRDRYTKLKDLNINVDTLDVGSASGM